MERVESEKGRGPVTAVSNTTSQGWSEAKAHAEGLEEDWMDSERGVPEANGRLFQGVSPLGPSEPEKLPLVFTPVRSQGSLDKAVW